MDHQHIRTSTARSRVRTIHLGVMFLTAVNVCVADEPGSALEELFLGETAYTQEHGESQLTIGADFLRNGNADSAQLWLEYEYGVSERLQLGAGLSYIAVDAEGVSDGKFGNLEVGIAWQALRSDRHAFSIAVEASLPTGNSEPDDDDIAWEPSLVYSTIFADVEFHAGITAEIESGSTEFSHVAALVIPRQSSALVFEASVDDSESYILAGVVRPLGHDGQLNIGIPIGVGRSSGDWGMLLGATWEF